MGVLIKGFEMPKDGCRDCVMVERGFVSDICPFLKREVNGNVKRGGKPNGCPLIEIPDTNVGDTISRQAAIDEMEKAKERYFDRRVIIGKMQDIVNNLPSAKPERKRGKWELIDDTEFRVPGYRCSACHCECEDWESKPTYNFCPNCGAEMKGKANDEN